MVYKSDLSYDWVVCSRRALLQNAFSDSVRYVSQKVSPAFAYRRPKPPVSYVGGELGRREKRRQNGHGKLKINVAESPSCLP